MKPSILILFLLLLALPVTAQVTAPQVPLTGNIGPQGNFPLFNNGTIKLTSDADHTLAYPEMTAPVLRITSSVPLTVTRNIINPSNTLGFVFTVQNATTGGQSIIFKGANGTGVTIPNGQAVQVMSDGTNYVSVGAAAGGYNVPSNYSTVQAAITAAVAAGSGPVTVSPQATDATAFTNPNGVRIQDYRQNYGADSQQPTRSVKEWGVKADAKILSHVGGISVVAGSPTVFAPTGTFSSADVNKAVVCFGCGSTSAGWTYPGSVVSGGSGGSDGMQQVTLTGGGCTTQPTGYVQVTSGVAGGSFQPTTIGVGCTSSPTSGTVNSVTGTVTFNSQGIVPADLVAKITAVPDSAHATLSTNVITNGYDGAGGGVVLIWGTDDTAAWQAAANAMYGNNSSGNALGYSNLTFCGFSMITAPVEFVGWGGTLTGCGWGSFNGLYGAKLISADATPGRPIIDLQNGQGAKIERIHFFGNTYSMPIGLQITHNSSLAGVYIGSYNIFRQLWFGPMYDGSPGNTSMNNVSNMTSGIKANGTWGNADYNRLETIAFINTKYGFDSVNANATDWDWQTLLALYNNVAFCLVGDVHGRSWIFGGNGLSLGMGGCTTGNLNGRTHLDQFIDEGTSTMIAPSPGGTISTFIVIKEGTVQIGPRIPASGNIVNMNFSGGTSGLELDNFNFTYAPGFTGPTPLVQLNTSIFPTIFHNVTGIGSGNIKPNNLSYNLGLSQPLFVWDSDVTLPVGANRQQVINFQPSETGVTGAYRSDFLGGVTSYGGPLRSLKAPVINSSQIAIYPQGVAGTTTYRYQIACVAGGQEGPLSPVYSTTTGNAVLSSANFNAVGWGALQGCDSYNVYGDKGAGAIGYLTNIVQGDFAQLNGISIPFAAMGFRDQGQFTKGAAPSGVDNSGSIYMDNHLMVGDPTSSPISYYPFDFKHLASYANPQSNANGFALSYTNGKWAGAFTGPQATGIPFVGPAGVSATYGYNTIGANSYNPGAGSLGFNSPFSTTVDSVLTSFSVYISTGSLGNGAVALYDSDGPLSSGPVNNPKTLLCSTAPQALVAGAWNTFTIPAGCYLSHGHTYWPGYLFDNAAANFNYDGGFSNQQVCSPPGYIAPFNFPAVLPSGTACTLGTNQSSMYFSTSSIYAWGTSYSATNPVPAADLGTGSTGGGTNCLKDNQTWSACATGTGSGLADPGANGIIKRTALNTTAIAVAADYPILNQNTTGTAGGIGSNGTGNQVWAMNAGATAQGWQTLTAATATNLAGGALGSVAYQSAASTTGFIAPNTSASAMVFAQTGTGTVGAAPTWTASPAISAANMTTFPASVCTTTSCNVNNTGAAAKLSGGALGSVPYQSAASTTAFLAGNTAATDQVLTSHGTGSAANAPTLSNAPALSATNMTTFPASVCTTAACSANTTGTAAGITGNGAGSTVWGMNSAGTAQGWQTAASGSSAPLYSTPFPGVTMSTTTGLLTIPAPCSATVCAMTTAPADGTYRFAAEMIMTGSNAGCTGSIAVLDLVYTDPDNNTLITALSLGRMMTASAFTQNYSLAAASTIGGGSTFTVVPIEFRAKNGTTISFQVNQTSAAASCTSGTPVFTVRPALYGPLGY